MNKISKGVDSTGLNRFLQQKSMFWKIDEKSIEVNYLEWYESNGGNKFNESTKTVTIKDNSQEALPERSGIDGFGNEITLPAQEAKEDTSGYVNYCQQFGANNISQAIDDYLTKL